MSSLPLKFAYQTFKSFIDSLYNASRSKFNFSAKRKQSWELREHRKWSSFQPIWRHGDILAERGRFLIFFFFLKQHFKIVFFLSSGSRKKWCACMNGGTCHSRQKTCECPEGYYGRHCEKVECRGDCLHGGYCLVPNVCTCPPKYGGSRCETRKYKMRNGEKGVKLKWFNFLLFP